MRWLLKFRAAEVTFRGKTLNVFTMCASLQNFTNLFGPTQRVCTFRLVLLPRGFRERQIRTPQCAEGTFPSRHRKAFKPAPHNRTGALERELSFRPTKEAAQP